VWNPLKRRTAVDDFYSPVRRGASRRAGERSERASEASARAKRAHKESLQEGARARTKSEHHPNLSISALCGHMNLAGTSASSPAAGGARGVSPRQPEILPASAAEAQKSSYAAFLSEAEEWRLQRR
jgi:hypothetical protein